jgi:hypothetical protein
MQSALKIIIALIYLQNMLMECLTKWMLLESIDADPEMHTTKKYEALHHIAPKGASTISRNQTTRQVYA